MLQNLSEEIRLCHLRAEACARRAKTAPTETLCADYLRHEQSWLELARSCYELQQRLTRFVSESRKRQNVGDRSNGHYNGHSLTARVAWSKLPGPGRKANDLTRLESGLITVVDDDDCARASLSALIESRERRTATFASAEEYLASDVKETTVCLLLDVHLLGMSGPDLQAHLIAERCCPPTVFVTGRFEEHVKKRVIEAGALGYLKKPCSEKALFDCIEKALSAI